MLMRKLYLFSRSAVKEEKLDSSRLRGNILFIHTFFEGRGAGQPLGSFVPVTVPEVFAKANSSQFPFLRRRIRLIFRSCGQIMPKLIKTFSIHHDACKRGTKQILFLDRNSNNHKLLRIRMLTIYINHLGGNVAHIQ